MQSHERYERAATLAVRILTSLDGERLASAARRAGPLCSSPFTEEHGRLLRSSDSLDPALHFLYRLNSGSGREIEALRRNEKLGPALAAWVKKANRILARDRRAIEKRVEQKQMAEKTVNALRRAAQPIV